ncbi:MAG: hypothetical protein ACOZCP_16605, partial [Pseudomonadota bacterium]
MADRLERMRMALAAWALAGVLGAARAQEAPPPPLASPEQKQAHLARAADLKAQAQQLRARADERLAASETECWKKFLVSACMDRARRDHNEARIQASRLEVEAKRLEREVRNQERT